MKSSCLSLAALILCLLPAAVSSSAAQVIPFGTSGGNYLSDVALLPGGGFAVVWSWSAASGPDADADVRMQWVRPDGSSVFPVAGLTVAGSPKAVEAQAVLAPHPVSGVFVAYVRGIEDRKFEVVVQRYDGDGHRLWTGDGVVAAREPGRRLQTSPTLVPDGDGGVYVCLSSRSTDGSTTRNADILCQHLDEDGQRLWSVKGLKSGGLAGVRMTPQAVPDGEGGLVVVWHNYRYSPGHALPVLVEGQHFAAEGTPLWGRRGKLIHRTRISSGSGSVTVRLRVVPDGEGGAVVAFSDGADGLDVVAQRMSRDGRKLWGSGTAVASGPDMDGFASLAAGPGGGAFVLYQDFGKRQVGLSIQRLDGAGRRLWEVTESAPEQADTSGVGDFDGKVLRVVWARYPLGGSLAEVRLLALDLNGNPLNGAAGELVADDQPLSFPRELVYDPVEKQGLVVWTDGSSQSAGALIDGQP
ncbi:MAG TPA: hypothetical protein VNM67_08025 [Thermoanaerobaculia bacterium]|jgi:hypothetical protein|nr:hypothetical protein [Thermoanaerobaculia bacterium]